MLNDNPYGLQSKKKAYVRPKKNSNNPYGLQLKKESRNFTNIQRKEIYTKNNGICQICYKPVKWKDFHADHIIPWTKDGDTIVTNGQCTHSKCNLKKSNKTIVDIKKNNYY